MRQGLPRPLGLALGLIGSAAFVVAPALATEVTFREYGEQAGVRVYHDPLGFRTADGRNVQNLYGPGVALEDVNNDGWLDLFVANGETGNYLFLNDGDGTFTDVSAAMRVNDSRVANGVALADINNNGYKDIVLGNFYREPQLYMNYIASVGFFSEASRTMGLVPLLPHASESGPYPESMGCAFGDVNNDGYIDLYVANYRDQPDVLYMNLGGGFQYSSEIEVTQEGYGFQALFFDFDDDADQDIWVANDFGLNFLFRNGGPASGYALEEVATTWGIAGVDNSIDPKSMSMGLAVGDYDNDLDLDVYITNFQLNAFWENQGEGVKQWRWEDVARAKGVEYPINCWGVDFVDLDLDTDLDLIQASGYIFSSNFLQPYENPNKVWLNNGPTDNHRFTDVSDAAGFNDTMMARGLATGDVDRDGDVDVVVVNNTYYDPTPDNVIQTFPGHLLLYENQQQSGRNWLNLKLEGSKGKEAYPTARTNRSGVGARVYVTAGGLTQMREIQAGASFMSQNSLEAEFGLGDATSIDEVTVRWTGGQMETFTGVQPNGFYRLVEGRGEATSVAVALVSFEAIAREDGVLLQWVTAPGTPVVEARVLRGPADDPRAMREIPVELTLEDQGGSAFDRGVVRGQRYAYRVLLVGQDGITVETSTAYATAGGGAPLARRAQVGQNFPNPFNPRTTILMQLPRDMNARLLLYDARGRLVRTLFDGPARAGDVAVEWDGRDDAGREVASGVYTYALVTEDGTSSRQLTLTR